MGSNESVSPTTLSYSSKTIGITMIGYNSERILTLNTNGSMFTINSGVTLTLDKNIKLVGRNSNNASLVYVNSGSNLIMNDGAKITRNIKIYSNVGGGGGVYINNGTFTMNGGEISDNTASSDHYSGSGGGVYINNGTFTMNGGEISGNTAFSSSTSFSGSGGGVYISNGTFTMNGGEISSNTASSSSYSTYGGGVYIHDGNITMNGGKISGNTAYSSYSNSIGDCGGGLYVFNGPFTMNAGEISGNTVSSSSSSFGGVYGGGVYVAGTFTKFGGTITGYASDTVNGNVVKKNNVVQSNSGHAVYASVGKRRESTAGPTVNLDSSKDGAAGGWE